MNTALGSVTLIRQQMRSSFQAFTVTSSLFCPLGPSSCRPASSTAIGFQGGGCQGRMGKSPGLAPGWPARGQGRQEWLTLVHFLASTSLGWLPGAKVPAPHWGQLLSTLSQRGPKNSGWLSLLPYLSREARRRSCLPSPSCLGLHSPCIEAGPPGCCPAWGPPSPLPAGPPATVSQPLQPQYPPPSCFPAPELGTCLYSCSWPTPTCRPREVPPVGFVSDSPYPPTPFLLLSPSECP